MNAILIASIQFPFLNLRVEIKSRNIITGDVKNNPVKLAIANWLDLVSAAMMFFAAIIPAYLSLKLKGDISKVTITLTAFIVAHGVYHLVRMQGFPLCIGHPCSPKQVTTYAPIIAKNNCKEQWCKDNLQLVKT